MAQFHAEGMGAALATVATVATLSLVLRPSPRADRVRTSRRVIALLVLLPETLAAIRAARRDRVQISLNLAFGSAMASIGLTIPTIAVVMLWLEGPLVLGLGPTEMVLLARTVVVGTLTVVPGRATLLQGGVHLAIFGAFVFLATSP